MTQPPPGDVVQVCCISSTWQLHGTLYSQRREQEDTWPRPVSPYPNVRTLLEQRGLRPATQFSQFNLFVIVNSRFTRGNLINISKIPLPLVVIKLNSPQRSNFVNQF